MSSLSRLIFLAPALLLCACAPYKLDNPKAGVCNELNSQIIFSGATSDARQAEIQSAEQPLVQQSYDRRCRTALLTGKPAKLLKAKQPLVL